MFESLLENAIDLIRGLLGSNNFLTLKKYEYINHFLTQT